MVSAWVIDTTADSSLLHHFRQLAFRIPDQMVQSIISLEGPTIQPAFTSASVPEDEQHKRFRQLFENLRTLEQEADGSL
jgi:hypothetical protein